MRGRAVLIFAVSVLILLGAPWFGVTTISARDILSQVWGQKSSEWQIFCGLRVPRVCMAWFAGATFALCGMTFQALFRNPLAEPSILGVSSGAALGAAIAIRAGFGVGLLGSVAVPASAFTGAIAAVLIVSVFARMAHMASDATLLLAGVAISSLFTSLIMVFHYTGGSAESYKLVSWTMGGISVVGLNDVGSGAATFLISIALSSVYATELDLMTFGNEIALTRGVELERTRRALFAGMSLSVAVVVASCGPIAFLGLIAPHLARRIIGFRHRMLAPCSAAVGGAALVLCDTAARTFWAPAELPVGIIISFLGAPFFLWLLFSRRTG